MRPSRALQLYYAATFAFGLVFTIPMAIWVRSDELGVRGAAILILSLNILFVMVLPLVMDWAESKYFKARFVALEELAKDDPELAVLLSSQCEKLSLPGLKLAVVSQNGEEMFETFSYGLWRNNPRLFLTDKLISREKTEIAPSIEAELTRFANQDHTLVFLLFAGMEVMAQNLLVYFMSVSV